MSIKILDCTLRDGGYINSWEFGKKTIESIIDKLVQSKIDIIELGFLTEKAFNDDFTLFDSHEKIASLINKYKNKAKFVVMINLEKENEEILNKLINSNVTNMYGIRLCFNPNEIEKVLKLGNKLIKAGFQVYFQPKKTNLYDDEALIKLIKKINKINPYSFSIVDTFGSMYKKGLLRLFYLIDNNLNENIKIGFHSHNNLQLSFSNAQALMGIKTKREIILDSSVFGMGRGAGNLATELVARYINDNVQDKYDISPLLNIYDEHLSIIYKQKPWGYSLPYFLSAVHNCHPNYATNLLSKQTISVESINYLLSLIPLKKRSIYDKLFINKFYIKHQKHKIDDTKVKEIISQVVQNRKILILAPGETIVTEKVKIEKFIKKENPVVISVNFEHENRDFMFISNLKKFNNIANNISQNKQIIVTSNIMAKNKKNFLVLNYESLLLDSGSIIDNAGLMLLNLLIKLGVKEVCLGGFDGFKSSETQNYFDKSSVTSAYNEEIELKNKSIKEAFKKMSNSLNIKYLTTSIYQNRN